MLQALGRDKTLLSKVLTIEPTARVERLRERYLDTKDKAVIDILRIRTRVMRETEGEQRAIREAKAFAASVREMPINIYPDELFVGWLFCEPRGSNLSGGMAMLLEKELDNSENRDVAPYIISDADKTELREDIIPYWTAHRQDLSRSVAHWSAGYEMVLEKGILGIKKDAEDKLAALDLTKGEEVRKRTFYKCVILALEAAAEIGKRFAAKDRSHITRFQKMKDRVDITVPCITEPIYFSI